VVKYADDQQHRRQATLLRSITADRRNVGMHARSNVAVQPSVPIFGAEDNVNDDLAKRLGHCGIAEKHAQVNRAVSAREFF
jgi:hypothetical protein